MSREDLDRLIAERSLEPQAFDDAQVAGFWSKAMAAYADARTRGISSESAFQLAYTVALQATFAVLAAHGLRVKSTASHYTAFYALQRLDRALRDPGVRFDKLRRTRHASIYEPEENPAEMAELLGAAMEDLRAALPVLRSIILAARPSLDERRVPIPIR